MSSPVNDAFDFAAVTSLTALPGARFMGAAQFDDVALSILDDLLALDHISILEPHLL